MKRFHSHIYFESKDNYRAVALAETARACGLFDAVKFHANPVGPHPTGMVEVQFDEAVYHQVVLWVEAHRGAFTAMIHEDTGDDVKDHTDGIRWFGPQVNLDFSFFELVLTRPDLRVHQ